MSGDAVRDQPASPAGVTPGGGAVPQEPRTAGGVGAGLRGRWANVEVRNLGLVAVLAVLLVVGHLTSDTFLTQNNIENILVSSSVIGVVTVGVTLVIIGGGIDLSVGALVALASVWATTLQTQSYGAVVMILCALTVGSVAGLVNGVLIAYGNLVPFIVTLAMLVSARGLAARLAQNRTQIVTEQAIVNIADHGHPRRPAAHLDPRRRRRARLDPAQPDDVRPPDDRHRRQRRGRPARRHRRPAHHRPALRDLGTVLRDRRCHDHGPDDDRVEHPR